VIGFPSDSLVVFNTVLSVTSDAVSAGKIGNLV